MFVGVAGLSSQFRSRSLSDIQFETEASKTRSGSRRFEIELFSFRNSVAKSRQRANFIRRRLRAPRHRMALGISASDSGVSHQDDAEQLRAVREISALHLQLHRRQSLSLDEGVLPGRFRSL